MYCPKCGKEVEKSIGKNQCPTCNGFLRKEAPKAASSKDQFSTDVVANLEVTEAAATKELMNRGIISSPKDIFKVGLLNLTAQYLPGGMISAQGQKAAEPEEPPLMDTKFSRELIRTKLMMQQLSQLDGQNNQGAGSAVEMYKILLNAQTENNNILRQELQFWRDRSLNGGAVPSVTQQLKEISSFNELVRNFKSAGTPAEKNQIFDLISKGLENAPAIMQMLKDKIPNNNVQASYPQASYPVNIPIDNDGTESPGQGPDKTPPASDQQDHKFKQTADPLSSEELHSQPEPKVQVDPQSQPQSTTIDVPKEKNMWDIIDEKVGKKRGLTGIDS